MNTYPSSLNKIISEIAVKRLKTPSAKGKHADFLCGVSLVIELKVTAELIVDDIFFRTNGCGYVLAGASVVRERYIGSSLREIDFGNDIEGVFDAQIGDIPDGRQHCLNLVVDAFRNAVLDFRSRRVSTWEGDSPLVCSCFGVSEEVINRICANKDVVSVESIGEECSAGTGCGSCQPVIEEIIESSAL